MLIDLHTHHAQAPSMGIERRMSYRPSEAVRSEGVYSVGLHPCYSEDMNDEALDLLYERLRTEGERIWAIGEAGLDKRSPVPLALQEHYLIAQIALSEAYEKPLVIHCVRAFNELIALRQRLRPRQEWIIHGYRRGVLLAEQLLQAGFSLSFGYYFDADALRRAHASGRMYIETDDMPIDIREVAARVESSLQHPI